jgi:hypothetical protein
MIGLRLRLAGIVALALACFAPAPAAFAQVPDPTPTQIIGFLNDYRARIGLPGPIAHDENWSRSCQLHNEYQVRNKTMGHSQDPAKPGYTKEGDWAARNSVLYWGGTWSATANPFETAPFHLHQLLNPRIDRMGASENGPSGCATSLASRNRAAPEKTVTYTYPANGATHRSAETAREGPYTPGSRVGIPMGTRTGPYLYLMFDGPWNAAWSKAKLDSAAMTGPSGPVEIKTVDAYTPGAGQYLPVGAEVIPVQPLAPGVTYTIDVAATVTDPYAAHENGGWVPKHYKLTHRWSFTTSAARADAARQDDGTLLAETDFPVPSQRRANPPPLPEILEAEVRGPNVHVTADVGEVGDVTAVLSNRRHRSRGKWRTIDVRRSAFGEVKLVGRVPVGVSWIRVDSKDLENFQPEVEHGPKDHPEAHSETVGPDGTEGGEAESARVLVRTR